MGYTIHGARYVNRGVRCGVHDARYTVRGIGTEEYEARYTMRGTGHLLAVSALYKKIKNGVEVCAAHTEMSGGSVFAHIHACEHAHRCGCSPMLGRRCTLVGRLSSRRKISSF